jgi:hypothetical protein
MMKGLTGGGGGGGGGGDDFFNKVLEEGGGGGGGGGGSKGSHQNRNPNQQPPSNSELKQLAAALKAVIRRTGTSPSKYEVEQITSQFKEQSGGMDLREMLKAAEEGGGEGSSDEEREVFDLLKKVLGE